MQFVMTTITVSAGMIFSLAVAILLEELIFGKVFCPLFARQAGRANSQPVYRCD